MLDHRLRLIDERLARPRDLGELAVDELVGVALVKRSGRAVDRLGRRIPAGNERMDGELAPRDAVVAAGSFGRHDAVALVDPVARVLEPAGMELDVVGAEEQMRTPR